jgi:hypothetical protein
VATTGNDEPYGPCPCGSGKKLKFCCRVRAARREPAHEARVVDEAWKRLDRGLYREVPPLLRPLIERGSTTVDGRMLLAIAHCAALELDAAAGLTREIFETLSPGNRRAGGTLAHILLLMGRRDEASTVVDRCLATPVRRAEDAMHVLGPAALLGRDEAVLELVQSLSEPAPRQLLVSAAIAAANLGRRAEGEALLGRVRAESDPLHLGGLLAYVRGARGASPWPRLAPLAPPLAVPMTVASAWMNPDASPGPLPRVVSEQFLQGLRVALVGFLNDNPKSTRDALEYFKVLHPELARAELACVWAWPDAGAAHAIASVLTARDAGLLGDDERVCMTIGGVRHEVRAGDVGLPASLVELPPHLEARKQEAYRLGEAGQRARARKLLESILQEVPNHPLVLMNLLVQESAMGSVGDAERLRRLRALVEASPRYAFARANLALELVRRDRADEAASLIDETHLLGAPSPDSFAHVAATLARVAMARTDRASAARFAKEAERAIGAAALETMAPDLVMLGAVLELESSAVQRLLAAEDRRLARRIHGEAPTVAWCELLTVAELKDAIWELGYRLPGPQRKAALARALAGLLEDPAVVGAQLDRLRAEGAQEALEALLAAGGRMPFFEAVEALGGPPTRRGAGPAWARLVARGMAMVATVDGTPALALAPAVVRALRPSADSTRAKERTGGEFVARPERGRWEVVALELPPIERLRPVLGMVVDGEDGTVLVSHVVEEGGVTLALSVALGKAFGELTSRPAVLEVASDEGRDALRAIAGEVPIERGPCARAQEAFDAMRREIPGVIERLETETWAGRGFSRAAARSFHEHAAALYRARPWDAVPDDGCVMRLTSSDGTLTDACVVVMGQSRTTYGLLLHDGLTSCLRARRTFIESAREEVPAHLGIMFEREDGVPPSFAFEVRDQRLPLAGPAAFPWLIAVEAGGTTRTTDARDVARMELAMRAVAQVTERRRAQLEGWHVREPQPTHAELAGVRVEVAFHTADG